MATIRGRVWKYGDDVNTDNIIPGRYLHIKDADVLSTHALTDLDRNFAGNVQAGDIIGGGRNLGCGSSREQAVSCLKHVGVGGIIAASFARIFFRNAINLGLPVVTSQEAVELIEHGQEVEVDLERGSVRNLTTGREVMIEPLPEHLREIVEAGGLIPFLKGRLKKY